MLRDSKVFSGFTVNDIDAAKQFYGETLGLKVEQDWMGLHITIGEGIPVFVYQKDDHVPASYTILNFIVDNIDETIDALAAGGIVMERYDGMPAPQDDRGILRGKAANEGPDIAWFKDPAGNVLSVLSN